MKQALFGKTLSELQQICRDLEMPAFAASQIADWLYKKDAESIDEMSNLSLSNRSKLNLSYALNTSLPSRREESSDGTVKYLFAVAGGNFVETVFIPDHERATLCVSSQVGCKMNCLFCMTGKQGFSAQLTANEILNQLRSIPESRRLSNVVFMGMGEPLDNQTALFQVLEILTASYGYAWSPKRITVSTIGHIPGLKRFLDESECHLAVSIHSPIAEERQKIMPVEKAFPIKDVIEVLQQYDFSHQRRLSFEYILFEGLNDSIIHAKKLVDLLRKLDCRVNLIRFHQIPGVDLRPSSETKLYAFRDYLSAKGLICTIRLSRGEDILAACGMLSTKARDQAIDEDSGKQGV
ncbi:50S rRNA methyltransferase [Bacteroidales bacterium]|nr:50S rRNA methyltransferase [Bacteroidales bacterium]